MYFEAKTDALKFTCLVWEYRLKVIATQRKQKLPRSLCFKPGGSVDFWQNLLSGAFKKLFTLKKCLLDRKLFFNLAEKSKSLIALNSLSFDIIE